MFLSKQICIFFFTNLYSNRQSPDEIFISPKYEKKKLGQVISVPCMTCVTSKKEERERRRNKATETHRHNEGGRESGWGGGAGKGERRVLCVWDMRAWGCVATRRKNIAAHGPNMYGISQVMKQSCVLKETLQTAICSNLLIRSPLGFLLAPRSFKFRTPPLKRRTE